VGGYNNFLKTANEYTGVHAKSHQLLSEMSRISFAYADRLQSLGLTLTKDGSLAINEDTLDTARAEETFPDKLSCVKDFTVSLLKKASDVSLNPMNYVERTVVAYKNPAGPNFPTPYVTSEYSGMLFNSYC
jgi:flagellar hook-associated protein 2